MPHDPDSGEQVNWTPASIRPVVLATIDIFGVDRCLFASNSPVDHLASGYAAIWQAFDEITADFSEGDGGSSFATMRRTFTSWGRRDRLSQRLRP